MVAAPRAAENHAEADSWNIAGVGAGSPHKSDIRTTDRGAGAPNSPLAGSRREDTPISHPPAGHQYEQGECNITCNHCRVNYFSSPKRNSSDISADLPIRQPGITSTLRERSRKGRSVRRADGEPRHPQAGRSPARRAALPRNAIWVWSQYRPPRSPPPTPLV